MSDAPPDLAEVSRLLGEALDEVRGALPSMTLEECVQALKLSDAMLRYGMEIIIRGAAGRSRIEKELAGDVTPGRAGDKR